MFFLRYRRPTKSTHTEALFPATTRVRSRLTAARCRGMRGPRKTVRAQERAGSGSAVAFEQLAPEQHAPDLVGAGADGIELGVAQDASGGVFIDVAVAAQRLDALQRHLHRGLGGVQQAAGRVDARLVAGVVVAGHLIGESARGMPDRKSTRLNSSH